MAIADQSSGATPDRRVWIRVADFDLIVHGALIASPESMPHCLLSQGRGWPVWTDLPNGVFLCLGMLKPTYHGTLFAFESGLSSFPEPKALIGLAFVYIHVRSPVIVHGSLLSFWWPSVHFSSIAFFVFCFCSISALFDVAGN